MLDDTYEGFISSKQKQNNFPCVPRYNSSNVPQDTMKHTITRAFCILSLGNWLEVTRMFHRTDSVRDREHGGTHEGK